VRELLLEKLAEPSTGAPLRLRHGKTDGGRIVSGDLVSESTGIAYPIRDGIPTFVGGDTYADSFGLQWNLFRDVQLDADTGAARSRARFDAEAGWDEGALRGRWVLDAGCGAGRFAEIAAARGANLVALDYSSAVHATALTLSRFPNVDVVRGSLLEPPFKKGTFDFAYCIGVVQHTPDPRAAVQQVVDVVRPGGSFCFTIYGRRPWTKLNAKYLLRPLTKRLPQRVLLRAIERVMPFAFPVTTRLFKLPVIGRAAQFAIPIANYVDQDDFTPAQKYSEAVLDTFDMLSPQYDSPMTWREVESALRQVGVSTVEFRTQFPVNAVGVR
jgi:SAM-dependent methyltransferase/uncharacterized protein YbaR (Trm112 family)